MFLKERERDYVQREKKKKKSVFVKNQSTARVPFDIPRERERRVPSRWSSKQRQRETIFKKNVPCAFRVVVVV